MNGNLRYNTLKEMDERELQEALGTAAKTAVLPKGGLTHVGLADALGVVCAQQAVILCKKANVSLMTLYRYTIEGRFFTIKGKKYEEAWRD